MTQRITRRRFLQAGSSLAAGGLVVGCGGSSSNSDLNGESQTAVVIGSGFGGSVAALRLAQAGISTTVFERGMHWPYVDANSYPLMSGSNDGRTTWLDSATALTGLGSVPRFTGMIERVRGDNIDAVCAAGVGGGSLVYGGVLLQPKREIFNQVLPFIDYDAMAAVYYPRVRSHISGGPIPDDILATSQYRAQAEFIQVATAAGLDVTRSDVGFDWNIIREEINGIRPAAASISEYIYGCNSGAKNSLDKNYLRDALATGFVTVKAQHQITTIRERRDGRYEVHGDVIDTQGNSLNKFTALARYVFFAAGSLNTSKLMLKCKQSGDLPGLNQWVGKNWGTNGDQLMLRFAMQPVSGAQGGPASIAATDLNNPIKPVAFMHSPTTLPVDLQIQLGMSIPDKLGEIVYDSASDSASVHWPSDAETNARAARELSQQKILNAGGGTAFSSPVPTAAWHPLGGMAMGYACSELGEVYGQKNLFVVDGSLMPGSTGCANPSLTIAANAERIMATIIPQLR